ncbi:MAG: hypothetical protein H0X29_07465 [Parachlamydiaceae bacterium]|nr:hypothetical protein [Parachlamydiaceae bacterium]
MPLSITPSYSYPNSPSSTSPFHNFESVPIPSDVDSSSIDESSNYGSSDDQLYSDGEPPLHFSYPYDDSLTSSSSRANSLSPKNKATNVIIETVKKIQQIMPVSSIYSEGNNDMDYQPNFDTRAVWNRELKQKFKAKNYIPHTQKNTEERIKTVQSTFKCLNRTRYSISKVPKFARNSNLAKPNYQ